MIKRSWLNSASFQPMNGQPVWVYHDGSRDIFGQQHPAGVHKALFHWSQFVHEEHPFWWAIPTTAVLTGALYNNRLWQPRLNGEMPDLPPAEKSSVVWADSAVQLPKTNQKVVLNDGKDTKAVFLWQADRGIPVWKCFDDTGELGESPLLVAHARWRPDSAEKPK